MIDDDDNDEFFTDSSYLSECCGSPIWGEVVADMGVCSRCKEWAGLIINREEE